MMARLRYINEKRSSYMALLRPTRLLISEKSATKTMVQHDYLAGLEYGRYLQM
jgi:hypothetical protein